jgi:hypothetical protein
MKRTFFAAIILLSVLATFGRCFAGGGPSEKKCEDQGLIDVTCITCSTGQKLGMISIQAAYDPAYGDCMLYYREARKKCSDTYGTALNATGIKWEYWMGATKYYGHYPSSCETHPKSAMGTTGSGNTPPPPPDDSKFSGKD